MLIIRKLPDYPVWHVESEDRWELAMTFLRIEEYYESPNPAFRGQTFSLEMYMDWYVQSYRKQLGKSPYGAFTYASDWAAFNVPGYAVQAVYETFGNHSQKEQWLFKKLEEDGAFACQQFYVIGNKAGAQNHFEHEYRHALFSLNKSYRTDITRLVEQFQVTSLREWILKHYSSAVLTDEVQAYALTGWPSRVTITEEMRELKRQLKTIEKKYINAT